MPTSNFVILDRDGVINKDSVHYIKSPDEWIPISGSLDAIAMLNQHGFRIVVVTNQSGLGRGFFDPAMLEKIHKKMHRLVEQNGGRIDTIYYCPHGPDEGCRCRKPNPGLLHAFAQEKHINLKDIPFVGDSIRDIEAGLAVGARPLLVKSGKGTKTLNNNPELNIPIFENLYAAAQFIISGQ